MFAFSTSRTRLSRSLEQTNELIIRMIITITIIIIIIVIIIIIIITIIIRRRRRRRRRRKYYDHHHYYHYYYHYYYYPSFPFLCCCFVALYTASPPTHPTSRTAAFRIQDPWNTKKTKVRKYFNILLFILFYIFIILTQFLCLYYETTGMINKLKYCIFKN